MLLRFSHMFERPQGPTDDRTKKTSPGFPVVRKKEEYRMTGRRGYLRLRDALQRTSPGSGGARPRRGWGGVDRGGCGAAGSGAGVLRLRRGAGPGRHRPWRAGRGRRLWILRRGGTGHLDHARWPRRGFFGVGRDFGSCVRDWMGFSTHERSLGTTRPFLREAPHEHKAFMSLGEDC
jgi:hypothetical protein